MDKHACSCPFALGAPALGLTLHGRAEPLCRGALDRALRTRADLEGACMLQVGRSGLERPSRKGRCTSREQEGQVFGSWEQEE